MKNQVLLIVGSGSHLARKYTDRHCINSQFELVQCDMCESGASTIGHFEKVDFASPTEVKSLFESERLNEVKKMIIFASENRFGSMGSALEEEVKSLTRNVALMYNAVASFGQSLRARGANGQALILSSINATIPVPGFAGYCISKSTIDTLIKCAAREFAPYLRVNAVAPGPLDKQNGVLKEFPGFVQGLKDRHLLERRLANCQDTAPVIDFLLSDDARWITGQTLIVDGGVSINWGDLQTT